MFANVKNIFGLSMGNHLESCKEDVRRFGKLFGCKQVLNCDPQNEDFYTGKNLLLQLPIPVMNIFSKTSSREL